MNVISEKLHTHTDNGVAGQKIHSGLDENEPQMYSSKCIVDSTMRGSCTTDTPVICFNATEQKIHVSTPLTSAPRTADKNGGGSQGARLDDAKESIFRLYFGIVYPYMYQGKPSLIIEGRISVQNFLNIKYKQCVIICNKKYRI